MLRNIYAPLSGGVGQERLLEILANNVANANTTGFKEEQISFRALDANPWPNYPSPIPPAPFKYQMPEVYPLHGDEMQYVGVSDIKTDFSQGSLRNTSNPLDFAVQGDGFFSVMTPFGERYTRDGGFSLSPDGTLITQNGAVVQGDKGAIVGLKNEKIEVLESGEVYCGGKYVDKIKTVSFAEPKLLEKLGSNLFTYDGPPDGISRSTSRIAQGYLESSNVNPMKNMTSMIIAHRTYEALQKTVKTHDDNLGQASKVGEVNG